MIKFFRRIRSQILGIPQESSEQNLLMENKTSKYIKYAIGEILLVVIGILIALQINNWNEGRKTKSLERTLLVEYQEELRFNYEELSKQIEDMQMRTDHCSVLLDAIEHDRPYVDSLPFAVMSFSLGLNLSHVAFRSIEDQGLDIIRNKTLKKGIVHLHTDRYALLDRRVQNQLFNIKEYARPIIRNRLKYINQFSYVPIDYDDLMGDVKVWNTLNTLRFNFRNLIELMGKAQDEILEIDELINKELK